MSLPTGRESACDLVGAPPEREARRLLDFRSEMMLPADELAAVYEDTTNFDSTQCFHDPAFDDVSVWCDFVVELCRSKIISFRPKILVQIGCFIVTKKSGKFRLTLDARWTNSLSRSSPRTALGGMEA